MNDGTIYLIHFERPVGLPDDNRQAKGRGPRKGQVFGASHYCGFAKDFEKRLEQHKNGNGSKLCAAARRAGIAFSIVRTWEGTRALERKIKNTRQLKGYCPVCKAEVLRKHREWYATAIKTGKVKPRKKAISHKVTHDTSEEIPF